MTGWDMGGGGGKSVTFNTIGEHVTGTVLDMKEVQQTDFQTKKPKFFDNGDPMMQFCITLQTELRDPTDPQDDGKRNLYVKGGRKPRDDGGKSSLCAVLDAIREGSGGGSELKYGSQLVVQYVGNGPATQGSPPKNYQAWYTPPAMDMQQPPQHAAPAAPPAPPEFGSQAHQQQVAPSAPPWATQAGPPNPQITPPGQPLPYQQPAPQAAAPSNPYDPQWPTQPAAQPQLPTPAPQAAPPAPPQQQPMTPTQAAGQAGQPVTREQVASLQNLGVDPAQVYGADWQSRVTP